MWHHGFLKESGEAGRDDQRAGSVVLCWNGEGVHAEKEKGSMNDDRNDHDGCKLDNNGTVKRRMRRRGG